jgi:pilus assembly protein Flp/PilA
LKQARLCYPDGGYKKTKSRLGASQNFPTGKEVNEMLFAPKEKGQGLVEYALILVLVAVVVIVILALLGPAIGNVFSNIVTNI